MYNKYVWNEDGSIKGEFELMYKEVDDPWFHSKEKYASLSTSLNLIEYLKLNNIKAIHSIGCGKGYYEKWISQQLNNKCILSGVDLSKTAIEFAKKLIPLGFFYASDATLDIKNIDNNEINIELTVSRYSEEHSDNRVRINFWGEHNNINDFSIKEKDMIIASLFRLLKIK